ncbi:MAG: hypothetical protein ACK4WH_11145 [Phycisphaerales bacterium]
MAILVLSDRNSVVRIDDSSPAGMFDWVVDGTDHLFQQWLWLRVGGDTAEIVGSLFNTARQSDGCSG